MKSKLWISDGKRHKPNDDWLKCQFCGTPMVLRWSTLRQHMDVWTELLRREEEDSSKIDELKEIVDSLPSCFQYVDDMQWKCPECDCCQLFGVAITREEFLKMKEARNGSGTYMPLEEWFEDELISNRLKALGYF